MGKKDGNFTFAAPPTAGANSFKTGKAALRAAFPVERFWILVDIQFKGHAGLHALHLLYLLQLQVIRQHVAEFGAE